MRRADREITGQSGILDIIRQCPVCTISLFDGEYPYSIPLNFGAQQSANGIVLYFHGAAAGRKMTLIEQNNKAGFSMSSDHTPVPGKVPCRYTMLYKSVCGNGVIRKVTDPGEKEAALACILNHYWPEGSFQFADKELESVTILKLTVHSITAKSNIHD